MLQPRSGRPRTVRWRAAAWGHAYARRWWLKGGLRCWRGWGCWGCWRRNTCGWWEKARPLLNAYPGRLIIWMWITCENKPNLSYPLIKVSRISNITKQNKWVQNKFIWANIFLTTNCLSYNFLIRKKIKFLSLLTWLALIDYIIYGTNLDFFIENQGSGIEVRDNSNFFNCHNCCGLSVHRGLARSYFWYQYPPLPPSSYLRVPAFSLRLCLEWPQATNLYQHQSDI